MSLLRPYIGQRVVEVGAGIGNYAEFLLDREGKLLIANGVQNDTNVWYWQEQLTRKTAPYRRWSRSARTGCASAARDNRDYRRITPV